MVLSPITLRYYKHHYLGPEVVCQTQEFFFFLSFIEKMPSLKHKQYESQEPPFYSSFPPPFFVRVICSEASKVQLVKDPPPRRTGFLSWTVPY